MKLSESITVLLIVVSILSVPAYSDTNVIGTSDDGQALVISTTVIPSTESTSTTSGSVDNPSTISDSEVKLDTDSAPSVSDGKPGISLKPEIYSFHIDSDIRYRYSRTRVTSRVVNRDPSNSQEVTFRVVLPETAFISKFIMEIDGKSYEAYVKEKEEAKKVYNQAQSQGQSAGLVELNTRNANVFDVSVNIKAQAKVNFNLTYEELLSRRLGRYEQSISISPEQITNVKDFQINVNIEESQNITLLKVPNLRNDIESQEDAEGNNKDAIIERPAANKANITWRPTEKDQVQLAKQGITGKFVVQYDIKRELDAGEVLVMNGYFVHFFAPENLPALRKHVVFVLDTSGSMWGRKMTQLKEAMQKILADLNAEDYFNILTFSSDVILWSPEDKTPVSPNSNWAPPPFHGEPISTPITESPRRRQPFAASAENIEKAQKFIQSLVASGGTNIQDSIVQALNLTAAIKLARDGEANVNETSTTTTTTTLAPTTVSSADNSTISNTTEISTPLTILPPNVESLIIFLTDGEPTVGVTDLSQIQTAIKEANQNISVPLFSLAFGEGADFPFVRKLSLQNNGFARKIYEASDAAIQLKGFYNEIASPLLSNVTFNYTSPEYSIQNLTLTKFATVFGGTEIAVSGVIVPKEEGITEQPEEATTVPPPASNELLEEVPIEGNQIVPTEKRYFEVSVGGFGRNGHVHFNNPEIFSSPIPWGIPVIRPFPPRPTPVPTQEDLFLERLWAYLTVQQLIEKDLAKQPEENEISSDTSTTTTTTTPAPVSSIISAIKIGNRTILVNTTVKPETPKQRALRLALKYGFVTSLTSLVVVKPNSSDVTDTVSASGNADTPDSLAAPQSFNHFQAIKPVHKVHFSAGRPSFTANRIALLPLAFPAPTGGSSSYALLGPGVTNFQRHPVFPSISHSFAGTQSFIPLQEEDEDKSEILATSRPTLTTTPGVFPLYTTTGSPPVPTTSSGYFSTDPTITSPSPSTINSDDNSTPSSTYPTTVQSSTTPTPELNLSTTTEGVTEIPAVALTLEDVTWYNETIFVKVNGTDVPHRIAVNGTDGDSEGSECGADGHKGHCTHLKDCLIPTILDDFKLYSESYFCSIESRAPGELFAGTCCASKPKKSEVA